MWVVWVCFWVQCGALVFFGFVYPWLVWLGERVWCVVADIALFGSHFDSFVWVDEDLSGVGEVGVNSGLAKARGFTVDTEVLTSEGWLLFSEVRERLLAERVLWESYSAFVASLGGGSVSSVDRVLLDEFRLGFVPLLVASVSPYVFDVESKERVGDSGRLVFVQPSGFQQWLYSRSLVRVKMRGLDLRMTTFADVVGKRKYRDGYGFVRANDLYENQYEEYFYLLLNKFSRSVGEVFKPGKAHIMSETILGWWESMLRSNVGDGDVFAETLLSRFMSRSRVEDTNVFRAGSGHVPGLEDVVSSLLPGVVVPTEVFVEGRGAEVYPKEYATRYTGYRDYVYNLLVPPYNNIVVRKHKPEDSERKWVGKPVVVGDGSVKGVPVDGLYLRKSGV